MKRSPVRLGDYFVQRFQGNADFRCEELNRCGEPLLLCYLDSLVDTSESTRLREMIAAITAPTASWKPVDAEADLDEPSLPARKPLSLFTTPLNIYKPIRPLRQRTFSRNFAGTFS
ncbi:hypothetical protein D478_06879 [Brevibacillus agri BAB-2500]|nr:hypothetical protein D478_06879 [Brevibacillus agri BAB-2500]